MIPELEVDMTVVARAIDEDGNTLVQFADGTRLAIIHAHDFVKVYLPPEGPRPTRGAWIPPFQLVQRDAA